MSRQISRKLFGVHEPGRTHPQKAAKSTLDLFGSTEPILEPKFIFLAIWGNSWKTTKSLSVRSDQVLARPLLPSRLLIEESSKLGFILKNTL